jgi:TolB-like protein
MSFFGELKRRNVIRVAMLYGVSSWLLLQFTDVLSSLLHVPDWTGSLVVLLLSLGFFPVMIFAWAYELTPEGIKRDKDVDRSQSVTSETGRRINTLIIVLLVVAIASVAVDRWIPKGAGSASVIATAEADDRPSIAVLPFADLSRDKDQQYFTDGISEELLNVLVRVDGLRVASRTSAFAFRDTTLSVPQLGEELQVGHVLEGSVRKDGDRIRITAQLIRVANDEHLWSENYDRDLKDIFKVQDEIANAIVDQLTASLGVGAGSQKVSVVAATENLDAYELYLKAHDLFIQREHIDESVALYHQAITLDPGFARAWEGLAVAEAVFVDWVDEDGRDHDALSAEAARKALELDPNLSMPFAALGSIEEVKNKNIVAAMDFYNQALEKDSKNTTAWLWRGLLYRMIGFMEKSRHDLERCLEIDSAYLNCKQHLAMTYYLDGDEETATRLLEETLMENFHSLSPIFVPMYVHKGDLLTAALLASNYAVVRNLPVKYWIDALQNPNGDHSAGLARFKEWGDNRLGAYSEFLLAARYYDMLTKIPDNAWTYVGDEFRQTQKFKQLARSEGYLGYWQKRGFPPQCEAVGKDDFRCD